MPERDARGRGRETSLIDRLPCTTVRPREIVRRVDDVAREIPVEIVVNGRTLLRATVSPQRLREFAIGHLLCEGHIHHVGDVESLSVMGSKVAISVPDIDTQRLDGSVVFRSCFGRWRSGIPVLGTKGRFNLADVRAGVRMLSSAAHRLTGGVHTCAVCRPSGGEGEPETILCEDVGRHNALDKVVGTAAMNSWPLEDCFAVSTGRGSSDMVAKCALAGMPLLVCRGAVTTLSVELARRSGICLMGFARGNRMNIYCNEWRIDYAPRHSVAQQRS